MNTKHTITISLAVARAMGDLSGAVLRAKDVQITGTLDQLGALAERLASAGRNQNTKNACRKASNAIASFVRTERAKLELDAILVGNDEEAPTCVACDGPLMFLGSLGNTNHFRCRDCGMGSYRPAKTRDMEEAAARADREQGEES